MSTSYLGPKAPTQFAPFSISTTNKCVTKVQKDEPKYEPFEASPAPTSITSRSTGVALDRLSRKRHLMELHTQRRLNNDICEPIPNTTSIDPSVQETKLVFLHPSLRFTASHSCTKTSQTYYLNRQGYNSLKL